MDNDWADFRLLLFMLKVLQHRSVREAAEELHTTSSNISRAAKKFYEQSGMRLYTLTKDNRIEPTEEGLAFPELVAVVFAAHSKFIAALKAVHNGDIRALRFGCGTFVAPDVFRAACAIHKRYLPNCAIHPSHAGSEQLANEVVSGKIDAAVVTLPVEAPELSVKELRRDRLVVCLRGDDSLALKATLRPVDFADRLAVLYDPERHPAAHARLAELLAEAGVRMEEYARASHPNEIQDLVFGGYGLALIREGTELRPGLITRPIFGVTWTVDTAFIYHKEHSPKTIPLLVQDLKQQLAGQPQRQVEKAMITPPKTQAQRPIKPNGKASEQLSSLEGLPTERLSA
jgi:DNA-binding transcriptional LysR family regulator